MLKIIKKITSKINSFFYLSSPPKSAGPAEAFCFKDDAEKAEIGDEINAERRTWYARLLCFDCFVFLFELIGL